MRIAVLAAVGLLLALWLWTGTDPSEPQALPAADPGGAGPGLAVRAPLQAAATSSAGLRVCIRRHGLPARARVTVRRPGKGYLQAVEDGVLDLHDLPAVAEATSDADCSARFAGLPPGAHHITAHGLDGGYATALVLLEADTGAQTVVLDLLAGPHGFAARLVEGPQPAPGWRVQLRIATDWEDTAPYAEDDPVWSSSTDADGRFSFSALPHGRYVVTALRPGLRSMSFQSVLIPTTGEPVFDVGDHEATLTGTVRDLDTDAPIAGATVNVQSDNVGGWRSDTLRTDAVGRFTAPVESWVGSVRVEANGYAPREFMGRTVQGTETRVIHLARTGRVEGRVVAARTGAAVAGAGVCLFRWRNSEPDARWVESDAEGRFAFADARPGEAHVFVLGSGHRSASFDIAVKSADPSLCQIRPGETTDLTLEVLPTTTLRGRVVAASGAAVVGARIVPKRYFVIRGVLVAHRLPSPHTGADGQFEFTDVVPGSSFHVEVWIEGRAQGGAFLSADPGEPELIEIRLEPLHHYVVEVLDATTDAPIPGAVVWVDDARAVYDARPWLTDAAGRVAFELAHEYFGVTSVRAVGYQPRTGLDRRLTPKEPERTFRLQRGEQITGRVHVPAGVPLTAAWVSLEINSDEEEQDGDELLAVLDGRGQFTLQGVPPGTHALLAGATWQGRDSYASLDAAAGARDLELRLEPEVDEALPPLRVNVRDARGRDLVRGMAFLFATGTAGRVQRDTALVHAGRALFRNFSHPPAWLVITPQHDASGLKSELMPALVGPLGANDKEVNVVLQRGRTVRGRVADTTGRPIAGVELHVTVTWRIGPFPKPFPIFVCSTHSDAEGRFTLAGLPQESVKIHVLNVPLGWLRPKPIELGAAVSTWDLELRPAARALIRVVDWRGNPVRRARVRWVPRREGWKDADVSDAYTDLRGRAEFGGLRLDDPVDLLVLPPEERQDCLRFELERAPLEDRLVQLPRGYALEATVLDAKGHPVPGAIIWRDEGSGWTGQGRTNENGVQMLQRVPASGISLRAARRPKGAEGAIVRVAGDAGTCTLRVGD